GHSPQRRRPRRPQPVKRINDAPHRAKQSDKRRDRGRNREPRKIPLETRNLFRCSNLHPALDGHQIPQRAERPGLPLIFLISAFEYADQRAGLELLRHRGAGRTAPTIRPLSPRARRNRLHLVRMMAHEIRLNASSANNTSLATAPVLEIMSTISPPTNAASKGKQCIAFF